MKSFKDIDLKLCNSCGTCVGVCPSRALSMEAQRPVLVKECSFCGLCFAVCPGREFAYPEFNRMVFGRGEYDADIGNWTDIYTGFARDESIRSKGSSGGVVTALLCGLLKRKEIGAAIVVGMDTDRPWIPQAKLAFNTEDILSSAQSKYSMVSVNVLLEKIGSLSNEAAFVGLPCHVHGIRKLQKVSHPAAKKIKYCIGLFCGFNMSYAATEFLIRRAKIKKEDIQSLNYRAGKWPGGFRVKSAKKEFFIGKHYYNFLNLFFAPMRCLACPDLTNEFADISIGDAWHKDKKQPCSSTIIVRTDKGKSLLRNAVNDLELAPGGKEEFMRGHAQLVLYKKKGVLMRQRSLGIKPQYDLNVQANAKERTINRLFFFFMMTARAPLIKNLLLSMPLAVWGRAACICRGLLNSVSRPKIKRQRHDGFFVRLRKEINYIRLKVWSFEEVGRHWDETTDYDDINKETYSYFRRFVDGYELAGLGAKNYVLDICSRTGNGTQYFWEKGSVAKAVCADFTKNMQQICSERLKKLGVDFSLCFIEDLPFPFKAGEFDAVLCFETIEHVADPGALIKELGRVLRPSGTLVLTTPNFLWGPAHALAAVLGIHHSEGPRRFLRKSEVDRYIREAGLKKIRERTTVLIPAGPKILTRLGEFAERRIGALTGILGLRRIFICRKISSY